MAVSPTGDLLIASPAPYHYATEQHNNYYSARLLSVWLLLGVHLIYALHTVFARHKPVTYVYTQVVLKRVFGFCFPTHIGVGVEVACQRSNALYEQTNTKNHSLCIQIVSVYIHVICKKKWNCSVIQHFKMWCEGYDWYKSIYSTDILYFVKAINAIISLSLQKSKQAPERYRGKMWCLPQFLGEYRGKVPACPGRVGAYADPLLRYIR